MIIQILIIFAKISKVYFNFNVGIPKVVGPCSNVSKCTVFLKIKDIIKLLKKLLKFLNVLSKSNVRIFSLIKE